MKYNLIILITSLSWAMPSYADEYFCPFKYSDRATEVLKLDYTQGDKFIKMSRYTDWEYKVIPVVLVPSPPPIKTKTLQITFTEDFGSIIEKHLLHFSEEGGSAVIYTTEVNTDTGKMHKEIGDCFHIIPDQLKKNADKGASVLGCDDSKSDNVYCWDEKPNQP